MILSVHLWILAQQVNGEVIDKALQVSPYNTIAYGVLVALLGFLWWKERADRIKWQDKCFKMTQETVSLLNTVESNLILFKDVDGKVGDVIKALNELRLDLKSRIS